MATINPLAAQTLYGWGHPTTYGAGYVGTPTYIPATSFYRSPQITTGYNGYAAPVTTFYTPQASSTPTAYGSGYRNGVAPATNTPPVTAAITNYSNAPITSYPPQTVLPTNYVTPSVQANRPVTTANYVTPSGTYYQPSNVANYATPSFYRTNYANTPVTYYRPVQVMDPVSGSPTTVLQPCTGYEWQARRTQTYRLFPWFGQNSAPQTTGYCPAGSNCGTGCGSYGGATGAAPYYVPNATTTPAAVPYSPYATPTPPSGIFPSGPTTIAPPATYTPGSTVTPGTTFNPGVSVPSNTLPGTGVPPASLAPSLNQPSTLNPTDLNSGPIRRDYQPANDSYTVPLSPPPQTPAAPSTTSDPSTGSSTAPSTGSSTSTSTAPSKAPTNSSDPADKNPSLNAPTNNSSETKRPQATIRRELNVTPIPDPERNSADAGLKKEPPQLLRKEDRTARTESENKSLQLVRYQQEIVERQPEQPKMKIFGDDAWRSAPR